MFFVIGSRNSSNSVRLVEVANKSRSTVYKTIRKLVGKNILDIESSALDKRSFLLIPKI